MMAGIVVPLRRAKAEEEEKFLGGLDKIEDEKERQQAERDYYSKKDVEVQVWLKDFPISGEDFKELRRSGAQH